MTRNPFANAALASLYIVAVASMMYYGPKFAEPAETVIVPIAMLSLFVLSAAVMGFLFISRPLRLYLDGEKPEAVRLFLSTVAVFALITVALFLALFSGLLS